MQQTNTERVYVLVWRAEQGDPLWIVQENEVWPCDQMVYAQSNSCPGELNSQTGILR